MSHLSPQARLAGFLFGLLGRLFQRRGNRGIALFCFKEAAGHNPNNAFFSLLMGKVLLQAGDLQGAAAAFTKALEVQAIYPEARNNLGVALEQQGDFLAAADCYRRALAERPNFAAAHNNLGNIHFAQSRLGDALRCYENALRVDLHYLEAHGNLGMILHAMGKFQDAEASCREAIRLDPLYAGAHHNLGNSLRSLGRLEEALVAYQASLALDPDLIQAKINLSYLTDDRSLLAEAIPFYENALKRYPGSYQAHLNLGRALSAAGRYDDAQFHLEEAVRLNPDSAETYAAAGNNFAFQANIPAALENYKRVFSRQEHADSHQTYLFYLNYMPDISPDEIYQEHLRWGTSYLAAFKNDQVRIDVRRDPNKRLRIGYVSSDFRQHSVAYFIEPVLRHHDRAHFEVHCFPNVGKGDAMTQRLKTLADAWHDTHLKQANTIIASIVASEIDILVDLSGHTSGNRMAVFAQKPAPLQISYLGYPNTTGLTAIDYRITDFYADPPGLSDQCHSEKLLRVPDSFLCYCAPEDAPEVAPCPALEQGYITFGSFNNIAKLSDSVVVLWSKILQAVPGSRLILKGFAFSSKITKQRFYAKFAELGIAKERVDLMDFMHSTAGHLELYGKIDIALDPFPYNGTTTTCESLWMGVPVVVLAGNSHVARVGVSLLTNVGLENWIADDEAAYLHIASRMASDFSALQNLRTSLRENMKASPLMDAAAFISHLERAYREAWRQYCSQSAPLTAADHV